MIKIDKGKFTTEGTPRQLASEATIILLYLWESTRRQTGEHAAEALFEMIVKEARDQEIREEVKKAFAESLEEEYQNEYDTRRDV